MFNIKSLAIIGILLIVIASNAFDLFIDITTGESTWHIIEESIVISLALALIAYLIINLKQHSINLQQLRHELKTTEHSLEESNARIHIARKEYSHVIHQQFDDWQLSQSQQQIALLLLKGLSFNEIAAIRETKEKTVRQQASEIYKKANVAGRHAFSAWFFEDFLN
ncbi:MAG: LuxR family transcriptional regulator [Methylococcaceae bacterium]|nr:LuxR family transcriptional regulator [Methylococcaceae bacterium]